MIQEIIKIEDIIGGTDLATKEYVGNAIENISISGETSTQYNLVLLKQEINWNSGFVMIPTDESLNINKEVTNVSLAINSVSGTKDLDPIIHYPSSDTYNSNPYQGFYIKDVQGLLREDNDFDIVYLGYNIVDSIGVRYDSKKQVLGDGFISNHENNPNDANHDYYTLYTWWNAVYPEYKGLRISSRLDPLTGYGDVTPQYKPTYAALKGCDLILRPYTGAYDFENPGSNANLLEIAAHSGNTHVRDDHYFTGSTQFPDNLILVSACNPGTTLEQAPTGWTSSFGYGVEFYEELQQQSPTTATVGAKLKKIQVLTGANWSLVRLAARKTASLTTLSGGVYTYNWNMYMGFGIININDAIQYIKDNYSENTNYRNMLADDLEGSHGLSHFLTYDDLLPNSPVAKRMLDDNLSNIGFLNFPVINPTIISGLSLTTGSTYEILSADNIIGFKKIDGSVVYSNSINQSTSIKGNVMVSIPKATTTFSLGGTNSVFSGVLNLLDLKSLLHLSCGGNQLTDVVIDNSSDLISLDCNNTLITTLNTVNFNSLSSLNVQNCSNLSTLYCYLNNLSTLSLTGCPNLTVVNCKNNIISSLNFSGLNQLQYIYANNNDLTSINISGCTSLKELYVDVNDLTGITKPNNTINYFTGDFNQFTTMDLSGLNNLVVAAFTDNLLSSVNVSGCTQMTKLQVQNNQLDRTAIINIINQTITNGLVNISTDYPNRLEFAGNPGASSIVPSDYTTLTSMGWIVTH